MNHLSRGAAAALVALMAASVLAAQESTDPPATNPPAQSQTHREQADDPPLPRDAEVLAPAALELPTARSPYPSVQVNVDSFGLNIWGDAANEPSLAIDRRDPNRIIVGWRQFDNVNSNFRQAGYALSVNGGVGWIAANVLDAGIFRSDPLLLASDAGSILYYSLASDYRCDLFTSTDGGQTWSGPHAAYGGDKAWITCDRSGGPGQGNIYVAWSTVAGCCHTRTFMRSRDGGRSFDPPIQVPLSPALGTLCVGVESVVYVAGVPGVDGVKRDNEQIVFARSSDAWDGAVVPTFELAAEVELGGMSRFGALPNPSGLMGQVWVAADTSDGPHRGNVYLLASVDPPGPDPADVHFVRSTDGGWSWSAPLRINDDAADNGAWQWFAAMSVAPGGRIDVIWNDNRSHLASLYSTLYYSYSLDGGQSWSRNLAIGAAFNPFVGYPNQSKLGDYYDLVSDDAGVSIAYAATYNGEQDVYFVRVGDCNGNGIFDGVELANGRAPDRDHSGIPDECEIPAEGLGGGAQVAEDCAGILRCDVDCSGEVDSYDIAVFTLALTDLASYKAAYPDCRWACAADLDASGHLDAADIAGFVDCLTGE